MGEDERHGTKEEVHCRWKIETGSVGESKMGEGEGGGEEQVVVLGLNWGRGCLMGVSRPFSVTTMTTRLRHPSDHQ